MRWRQGRAAAGLALASFTWLGVLQSPAHAASVDLAVTIDDDGGTPHAMGETLSVGVSSSNNGDADSGVVTVTFTATHGTIGTVDQSSYPDIDCTPVDATHLTCTYASLVAFDYRYVEIPVTADTPATGTSEQVSLEADISSPDADANAADNTSTASFSAVRAPAVTITHQFLYDPTKYYPSDPTNPALTAVRVYLKDANGATVPNQVVHVSYRPVGASTWHEGDAYPGDSQSDYVFIDQAVGAHTLEFKLTHDGNIDAGAAQQTFTKAPRATVVHQSAATLSSTYGAHPVLKGSLTFADDQSIVGYAGNIVLQKRAPGATAWQQAQSVPVDGSHGTFQTTISTTGSAEYRWRYVGQYFGAASADGPPISVTVHQAVVTTLSPVAIPPGGTATLTVAVKPGAAGQKVTLQRKSGTSWKSVESRSLSSESKRTWTLHPTSVGAPVYRFTKSATGGLAAGVGRAVTLTVTKQGKGPESSFNFEGSYNGHPAGWNPCATIAYKVNLARSPKGALADVKETIRRIHLANGLRFRYAGTTSEVPRSSPTTQHAEMLIGWRPQSAEDAFQYGAIGLGGYVSTYRNGHEALVRGYVILDADYHLKPGFGRGATEGQLLMHELGHAVGLAHSNGKYQIMRPSMDNYLYASMYGAGDLKGLRKVGKSQGCF